MRCALLALLVLAALPAPADSPAKDKWTRLVTPDFELFTSAAEKAGREALLQFEQVRGFFLKVWPERSPSELPVRIVVFRNHEEFAAYSTNPIEAAYFAPGPERDYIVMADASSESYGIAVHEYFHLIVRRRGVKIPIWLNEGLAEVYSTLRPVRGGVAVGDLIPQRMEALTGKWLTFESLTSVDTHSQEYKEADRVGVFYGESWALAHMLFLAPEYSPGFTKFVNALHAGHTSAEACQIAWGRSSEQVFDDLRNYFGRKKIYGTVFETSLDKSRAQPAVSTLAEFDTRLMLADLLSAIRRFDDARREFEQLAQQQPGRPEPAQSLGYLALQAHSPEGARQYFEKAFAVGDADPRMCLQLATMEHDARQPPEKILPILERAVNAQPDYTDALLQLGLARIAARQYEPAIGTLLSIADVNEQRATPLFSALAYAYLQTGDLASARKHAETAKKWAINPKQTEGVDRLLSLIDARSTGPFVPHPGEKLARVEGLLQGVECTPDRSRLHLRVAAKSMTFDLPAPRAVEFTKVSGGGTTLKLACGPQKPFPVVLDYAPVSVMEQGSAGVVRRLEY